MVTIRGIQACSYQKNEPVVRETDREVQVGAVKKCTPNGIIVKNQTSGKTEVWPKEQVSSVQEAIERKNIELDVAAIAINGLNTENKRYCSIIEFLSGFLGAKSQNSAKQSGSKVLNFMA